MAASISFSESVAAVRHDGAMSKTAPLDRARGKRIAYLRKEVMGLASQAELASRFQREGEKAVSRGAVGNWERGGDIALDNVRALAAMAGTSFEWIMDDRGPTPEPMTSQGAPLPQAKHPSPDDTSDFFQIPGNRARLEQLPSEKRAEINSLLQAVFDAMMDKVKP